MYLRNSDNDTLQGLMTTVIYNAISSSSNLILNIDKELLAFDGDTAKIEHCNNRALTLLNKLKISNDDIDDSEKRQADNFLRNLEDKGNLDIQYFIDLQCKYFVRDEIGVSFNNKTAINDLGFLVSNNNSQSAIIIEKIIKSNNLSQKQNSLYLEKIENFKKYMVIAIESHWYKVFATSIRKGKYPKRSASVISIREERIKNENLKLDDIIKNGLNLKNHSFELNESVKDNLDYSLLTDLKNSLKNKKYILSTKASDFKKIFTGEEITKKIIWSTTPTDLAYFIQKLLKVKVQIKKPSKTDKESFTLIKDTKQKHWEITARCFVKKDGTPFLPDDLSGLKKPAKSDTIDNCFKTLKKA